MTIYTATVELNVDENFSNEQIKFLENRIDEVLSTLEFDCDIDKDYSVRVSNIYRNAVYIPPTLKE